MSADAQEGERLGVGGLPIHGGLTPVTEEPLCYFRIVLHGATAEPLTVDVPFARAVVAEKGLKWCVKEALTDIAWGFTLGLDEADWKPEYAPRLADPQS
jgi:hypothetical protein